MNLSLKPKASLNNRSPLKLMYITNKPVVAEIAEKNGVDRIWVDLETIGKTERQGHVNSVKSNHVISDVSKIRYVISRSQLLVRVNPLHEGSKCEIDEVIERGADIVMLPMFKTADDAKRLVEFVNGRAKVILIAETIEAEKNLDETAGVAGVDEIYIGLNDLHLAYKMNFMFELLANGTVDKMVDIIHSHGITYGFGGIARLDEGMLPARHIIAEHYRLGSSLVILSRSFYDSWLEKDIDEIESVFKYGITEIREYEKRLTAKTESYFISNHLTVEKEVQQIVDIQKRKSGNLGD